MKGRIKTLALVFASVMAVAAVGASAASASNVLKANSYPATVTASQEEANKHVFTLKDDEGIKTECKEATFSGTLSGPTSEPSFTPTYNGCTSFLGISAEVKNEGCVYKFTIENNVGTVWPGKVDLICNTSNKRMRIHGGTCTVTVTGSEGGVNQKLAKVEGENKAANEVRLKANVTGIHYTVTEDGFLCPLKNGQTSGTEGTYTGNTIGSANTGGLALE